MGHRARVNQYFPRFPLNPVKRCVFPIDTERGIDWFACAHVRDPQPRSLDVQLLELGELAQGPDASTELIETNEPERKCSQQRRACS